MLGISVYSIPYTVSAATAESVQQQINDTNSQIQALTAEIAHYQDQISQTAQQSNTLANLIKQLTLTRDGLLTEQQQTQKKISATGLVITTLDTNITAQQQVVSDGQHSLAKMIKDLYYRDQTPFMVQLLSQDNIADTSRQYNDILTFNQQIRSLIAQTQQNVQTLANTKEQKVTEKKTLTTLQQSIAQKAQAIQATEDEKNTLLAQTKNSEAAYKKLLADGQQKYDAFEKSLEAYQSQLQFILHPSLLPAEGSGVLSWPLDKVFVTQLFGKTVAAKRLYVSGSHSGVDFRASIGTPVKSMGTGTVIGVGDTDMFCKGASFGKWVFIRYNNGLSSTFGHLSVISSVAGQNVVAGDVVGLSGNTGHTTAPHLHVTVYASEGAEVRTVPSLSCSGKTFIMPIAPTKAYLDPMLYLPQLPAGSIKNDTSSD
jgi:murein DD-endopeptidase MepM/ murein hydrolase activator NlpD